MNVTVDARVESAVNVNMGIVKTVTVQNEKLLSLSILLQTHASLFAETQGVTLQHVDELL